MKQKILIVNNNLHTGGVQRSLVNLLKEIRMDYDVTLLLFHPAGDLMSQLPPAVTVITPKSGYRYLGMTRHDICGKPVQTLLRSFFAATSRIFGRSVATSLMSLTQRPLRGYDVAISFLHDGGDRVFYGGCNDFVLRHVPGAKKITFLHCDYSHCGANTPSNARRYAKFDTIAACSDGCAESFLSCCPGLRDKVLTVPNCQDYGAIRSAALEHSVTFPKNRINLLTVARLGREKGVGRAIKALADLPDRLPDWHYYILGDGVLRPQIEELISASGLSHRVTLLGELPDPYGHMAAADLLVIPSVSEAAPMVIGESVSLGTPVLSTQTSSAIDMIAAPGYGWVCKNTDRSLTDALLDLLSHPERISEKANCLSRLTLDNQSSLAQFHRAVCDARSHERRDTT